MLDSLEVSAPELPIHTGLDEKRAKLADSLGHILADTFQIFIKTQGVHWNVAGPQFYSLHKLTEEQYNTLFEAIDIIAERIRALGEKAPASYRKYGELSQIKDYDVPQSARDMVDMLATDHEAISRSLRDAVEDTEEMRDHVTSDMLIDRLTFHEQAVWMLRAIIAE